MIIFYPANISLRLGDGSRLERELTSHIETNHPGAKRIGIIAPTGPELIQAWHACLSTGRTPLLLQTPTKKMSRVYWDEQIGAAIASTELDLLVCSDENCTPTRVDIPVVTLAALLRRWSGLVGVLGDKLKFRKNVRSGSAAENLPQAAGILQMSSGTTGHRKGIYFDMHKIRQHAAEYNKTLKLTSNDVVVSWLPLYHDMGFVAAFLLSQLASATLILIDPIEWVKRPELLLEAIRRHRATVCFMPNFGFELMAKHKAQLDTMRLWISCSEPTRGKTIERFRSTITGEHAKVVNCWGMAENIFAVSQSTGIETRTIDGEDVVSCGRPIFGTSVKEVDGELYVKSGYSITSYIGHPIQLDEEGYYPTGDLGRIVDGEIFLTGRRADLMNTGGRKFLLSDIDFAVGEIVAGSAGRIAAIPALEETLGTETLTILIEDPAFWQKNRDAELLREIISRVAIESARVFFVPPRFITKTSSGKVNRKTTRRNWEARNHRRRRGLQDAHRMASEEIRSEFPWIDVDRPLEGQIDSLGLVNLRLTLGKFGLNDAIGLEQTLASALAGSSEQTAPSDVKRIVCIGDGNLIRVLGDGAFQSIIARSAVPVQVKHVCVPPPQILLSDLVFLDYFSGRAEDETSFDYLDSIVKDLREASVILVDEATALFWPQQAMVYPKLNHDFQHDPMADLLGVRWAGYSASHHLMPLDIVNGYELSAGTLNQALDDLSSYLNIPLVRVAYGKPTSKVTADWDVRGDVDDLVGAITAWKLEQFDRPHFSQQLQGALERALEKAPPRAGDGRSYVDYNDQPHWCGWLVNKELVDFILAHFKKLAVLGRRSSVPYLAAEAARRGVEIEYRLDLTVPEDCDCVVQNGSWGEPRTDKPIFQLMGAGWVGDPAANLPSELAAACPVARVWSWAPEQTAQEAAA